MTKRTSAKYKIDRRMGENIWGRPKSPVNKREYGPGQHGQRRKNKLSDFGTQLRAKQKLKGYYGDLTEKQFRKIYAEAERVRGDTGEMLVGLLERRLDAVVYRAKLVPTIFAARQFVNHGHVLVNGKRVNIASYRVKEGDVDRGARRSRKQMALILEAIQLTERDVPDYLEVDHYEADREVRPHSGPGRRALSGADGTEPGRRILRQELILRHLGSKGPPARRALCFFGCLACCFRIRNDRGRASDQARCGNASSSSPLRLALADGADVSGAGRDAGDADGRSSCAICSTYAAADAGRCRPSR